jgi:hypothetical protein
VSVAQAAALTSPQYREEAIAYWPTIRRVVEELVKYDPQHMRKLKLVHLRLLATSLLLWDGVEDFERTVERVLNISELLWIKREAIKRRVVELVKEMAAEDPSYLHDLWAFVRRAVKRVGVRASGGEPTLKLKFDPKKNRYVLT